LKADFPSRAQIEAEQLDGLRALLTEIFPGNRFYSSRLQSAAITFDVAGLADFSRRFPFTTKSEIVHDQIANPPFGTNLTYPLVNYTRFHQTSGTTGTPLRWLDTPESWGVMLDTWTEVLIAAGVEPADHVYFAFSFGPFIGFWLAFESAARLGCLCIPGGGLSSAGRLRAIIDNKVTVLCCTPTYALHLAQTAAEQQLDWRNTRVKTLIVAGEPGGSVPAVRARLSELWGGAKIFDHHGMTEVGPVTHECPARPGVLHISEPTFYAEVCDAATGASVPPGNVGELVLTTLGRIGSPLLRYRTGDLVRLGPKQICGCGRNTLTLEGGILGRHDDMVVVRGVNVFPSAVDQIVQGCAGVAEYEVTVDARSALPEISIRVEPAGDCESAPALVRELEKKFETALALRVSVVPVPARTLPRAELKAKRWKVTSKSE
jgi:phenylacetate-CoA ligase